MPIPDYFLTQPEADWSAETIRSFDELFDETLQKGAGDFIDYRLVAPKWQFLCHLCDTRPILVHGSGNSEIEEFEPRQSNDVHEFGNQKAIYAASDGIWAMYFAIVDRERYVKSLMNSCVRTRESDGRLKSWYFFSINGDALPHAPWRNGTIYLLPGETFEQQKPTAFRGMEVELAQWASAVPVKPLARLQVTPEDFPFLAQMVPHDPSTVQERARANPGGFPWIEGYE
jgi:hypothetical protein